MAKRSALDRDLKAQQAAFLYAEFGWTQTEIGRHLGVTQGHVAKLVKYAERAGWVQCRYRFITDALPPDRVEALRRLVQPTDLRQLLMNVKSDNDVRVREVHVVGSPSTNATPNALARRLNQFGDEAARLVSGWLPQSELFGVTWGTTISHVVNVLQPPGSVKAGRLSVRFTPVCCEPLDKISDQDTSSKLAHRLHERVQTTAELPPSLTGVPALIARQFRGAGKRAIQDFFSSRGTSYQEVFGPGPRPLINVVDSLLTSVGPASKPMGFIHDELLRTASTPQRRLTSGALARLVAGDLGGVLIPLRTLKAADRREVEALNAMWTGIRREHLERIATEADKKNRPGVIVVSIGGSGRAETIAELVRCGLVNVLIVDPELAAGLTRVLSLTAGSALAHG
jgi:DNA-binding transcriptional regulator LsrR (DeoR family)